MVKLSRIYTRTGDNGTTGLGDGSRVSKDSLRIEAIGTVDEANAALGVCRLYAMGPEDHMLGCIQNDLFDVGADLCTPANPNKIALRITQKHVVRLEEEMDEMNKSLSPLTSFVLPGGTPPSAFLHQARTIVRRAERTLVALCEHEWVNEDLIKYINRLSDHLFVMARYHNSHVCGDVLWEPGKYSE